MPNLHPMMNLAISGVFQVVKGYPHQQDSPGFPRIHTKTSFTTLCGLLFNDIVNLVRFDTREVPDFAGRWDAQTLSAYDGSRARQRSHEMLV